MSTDMRMLHVAALPFPSAQGTQALIHSMLSALHAHGHDVELLCYAHGAGAFQGDYALTRAFAPLPARSLHSGPSLEKLALDAGLLHTLRLRLAGMQPSLVIAHHVEAALLALAVSRVPVVYVAHTSLEAELPYYFAASLALPMRGLGGALDRALCKRAARVLAVSPMLARALAQESGASVQSFTLPWPTVASMHADERRAARRELGFDDHQPVLLYAGNLDAYQGLSVCIEALSQLVRHAPNLRWLIATESPHAAFRAQLEDAGLLAHVSFTGLADELARRRVHAASDVALVPRASPGGVPIKLLDAMARGLPVVASERALAGLPLATLCRVVPDQDPAALCGALCQLLAMPETQRRQSAARARQHMAEKHAFPAFTASFFAALAGLAWP
jgi:glycosyltransferase involved in cell wall biosynthesis